MNGFDRGEGGRGEWVMVGGEGMMSWYSVTVRDGCDLDRTRGTLMDGVSRSIPTTHLTAHCLC